MTVGRLLILDDDPATGETIRRIALGADIEARLVTDPGEFFTVLDEWRPTHLAIDLVMPEMDGVQVMNRLAERRCEAGIIITSGVGSRVLDAAGRSAIANGLRIVGILPKPFSPMTLRKMLRAHSGNGHPGESGLVAPAPEGRAARRRAGVVAGEIRQALARDELDLVYQPKIECATGELAGFEALVRWHHPQRDVIEPDRFIPVAEQAGIIDAITDRVLDKALHWFASEFGSVDLSLAVNMAANTAIDQTLSINLSARLIEDAQFVERLTTRCEKYGVEPRRVILELTETSAMDDPKMSLDLLTRLRMKEFQLAIDDFGTGFSSMVQLVRLPFSEIKVDKAFVMTASESEESRTVIRSIVELGHSLGLQVVAEGVEDPVALDYLRAIGCDMAQGFYIARPMPAVKVRAWVENWVAQKAVDRFRTRR
jgi:EAL domain-containing protein (putative c-di-GMP-specific phosphodiesterase class I)